MDLDDLPAFLLSKGDGIVLNNLFQLQNGTWRANLRIEDPKLVFEFGEGSTPSSAIYSAIAKLALGGKTYKTPETKVFSEPTGKAKQKIDISLEDLEL